MYGAAGPLAVYGAGVPIASNAAGVSSEQTYDAITPSAPESAMLGFMSASHSTGLQSGGMVGYSTFFTGYDPGRDGMARALSMGRLGGQAVSMSARAMKQLGFGGGGTAGFIDKAAKFDQYGMGVFASKTPAEAFRMQGRGAGISNSAQQTVDSRIRSLQYNTQNLSPNARRGALHRAAESLGRSSTPSRANLLTGDPDAIAKADQRDRLREAVRGGTMQSTTKTALRNATVEGVEEATESAAYRYGVGVAGGMGYKDSGKAAANLVYDEDLKRFVPKASSGSKGATILSGNAGKFIGGAAKAVGAYEIAKIAVDAASYAAGKGYESLVETTTRLQRRVGADDSMSGAYYNRAAVTERQRAVQTMNRNKIAPRTQVMGNEAYYAH